MVCVVFCEVAPNRTKLFLKWTLNPPTLEFRWNGIHFNKPWEQFFLWLWHLWVLGHMGQICTCALIIKKNLKGRQEHLPFLNWTFFQSFNKKITLLFKTPQFLFFIFWRVKNTHCFNLQHCCVHMKICNLPNNVM